MLALRVREASRRCRPGNWGQVQGVGEGQDTALLQLPLGLLPSSLAASLSILMAALLVPLSPHPP